MPDTFTLADGSEVTVGDSKEERMEFMAFLKDTSPDDYSVLLHAGFVPDDLAQGPRDVVPEVAGMDLSGSILGEATARAAASVGRGMMDIGQGVKHAGLQVYDEYSGEEPVAPGYHRRVQDEIDLYQEGIGEDLPIDVGRMTGNVAPFLPLGAIVPASGGAAAAGGAGIGAVEGAALFPEEGGLGRTGNVVLGTGANVVAPWIVPWLSRTFGRRDPVGATLPPGAQENIDFARDQGYNITIGQATRDPEILLKEKTYGIDSPLGAHILGEKTKLSDEFVEIGVGPRDVSEQAGGILQIQKNAMQDATHRAYQRAHASAPDLELPRNGLLTVIEDMDYRGAWDNVPSSVRKIANEMLVPNKEGVYKRPNSPRELMILDEAINESYGRSAPADRALKRLKAAVMTLLDTADQHAPDAQTASLYRDARRKGKKVHETFAPKVIKDMIDDDFGHKSINNIVSDATKPEDVNTLMRMTSQTGATQAIRNGVKDYIIRVLKGSGDRVNPAALQKVINDIGGEKLMYIFGDGEYTKLMDLNRLSKLLFAEAPKGARMTPDIDALSPAAQTALHRIFGRGGLAAAVLGAMTYQTRRRKQIMGDAFQKRTMENRMPPGHSIDSPPPELQQINPALFAPAAIEATEDE